MIENVAAAAKAAHPYVMGVQFFEDHGKDATRSEWFVVTHLGPDVYPIRVAFEAAWKKHAPAGLQCPPVDYVRSGGPHQ